MARPNQPRWMLAGHPTSQPDVVADELKLGDVLVLSIIETADLPVNFEDLDAFALVVNAKTGISSEMIELWSRVAERQVPRIVIVNGLELSEIDFDDIVLIVNRVLENVITPYLVLHDELGEPTGLISLSDSIVHDYSSATYSEYTADEELISLIKEFKEELDSATTEFDDSAYSQGLLVPAIPLIAQKKIGKAEIMKFAELLTRR